MSQDENCLFEINLMLSFLLFVFDDTVLTAYNATYGQDWWHGVDSIKKITESN